MIITTLEVMFEELVRAASIEAEKRVLERIGNLVDTEPDSTWYINEAADFLGISSEMLRRMCSQKRVPHMRAGSENSRKSRLIFSSRTLREYRREQEQKNYNP